MTQSLARSGPRILVAVAAALMLFAMPVAATEVAPENTNDPHYWEHEHPGTECEKLEGEGISGEASWTADADYAVVIVKGGADQNGGGDEIYLDVVMGDELFAPLNPNTEPTDDHFNVSHVIVCTTPQASLTIEKDAGGNTTESFDFGDFDLLGGGSTTLDFEGDDFVEGSVEVTITESLTEAQVSALWELADITCDEGANVTIDVDGGTVTVTLADGDDVTCTFFNEQGSVPVVNTPTLSLEKAVTSGNANLGFGFTLGGTPLATTVTASEPARLLASASGTYVIAELARAGWNLAGIDCSGNAVAETVTTAARSVSVTVGADEDVICTFTNAPEGTQAGNPSAPASPAVVRQGTLASSVPNTAMNGGPTDQAPAAILGLLTLGSLAYVARRNMVASKYRS